MCDEEDDDVEDVNNCLRSLNFYKDKFFGEYHQSKKDDTTFIKTTDQIKNKKCTINPQNKDNQCFQYLNVIQKGSQRLNHLLIILTGKILTFNF